MQILFSEMRWGQESKLTKNGIVELTGSQSLQCEPEEWLAVEAATLLEMTVPVERL